MRKKKVFLLIVILLFILAVREVLGIGLSSYGDLSPPMVDFEPNLIKIYSYMLKPTISYTTDYSYIVEGDLAEYVFFDPAELRSISPGENPWFKLILRLPASDEGLEPGIHNVNFGVVEGAKDGEMVGAVTSIKIKIPVRVLHPGKYLVASLEAEDTAIDSVIPIKLNVDNWGKETIEEVRATVEIYEGNVLVDTLLTGSVGIKSGGSDKLEVEWDAKGYAAGNYKAKAVVYWDGETAVVNDSFRIGELEVAINKIQTEMEIGKINAFTIEVESGWNSPVQNIYFTADIGRKNMQSPTVSISPFAKKNLTAYFDTTGMEEGEYKGELKLFYEGRSKKKEIKVKLVGEMGAEPEITEVIEEKENEEPNSFPYVTAAIIAVLTMVIGILIANMIKKKRGELEDEEE